jgi:hypothetical protein
VGSAGEHNHWRCRVKDDIYRHEEAHADVPVCFRLLRFEYREAELPSVLKPVMLCVKFDSALGPVARAMINLATDSGRL